MLDQLSASEAVDRALQVFQDRENSRFWPSPLIRFLERLEPKLALRWAILLFQELLAVRRKAGSEDQQQRWLADLMSLIEREDVAEHCNKVAYEIWNNDPNGNLLERGIARLYWALQNYQIGSLEPHYYLQIASAVAMLADNGKSPSDMDEPTVEHAVSLFHRLIGEKEYGTKS